MQLVQVQSYGFLPVVAGISPPSQMAVSLRGRVSPARRRLFASDSEGDAQELDHRRTVERQMDQLQREKTEKWNFDFKNEVPLGNGRYIWEQNTTLPDCRPFNPLPPPTGIKRPIDNQQLDSADAAPLFKQMKPDYNINKNHRFVNQTKITGKYLKILKKEIYPFVCELSQGLNLETRVYIVLASVRRGWSYKQKMVGVCRGKSSRSPRSRLVFFKKRGGRKYEILKKGE